MLSRRAMIARSGSGRTTRDMAALFSGMATLRQSIARRQPPRHDHARVVQARHAIKRRWESGDALAKMLRRVALRGDRRSFARGQAMRRRGEAALAGMFVVACAL